MFSVSPSGGVCAPWTFTLPFTPPLEYTWSLSINTDASTVAYITNSLAGSFRAAPGSTTSRAITSSNLPLFYVTPDRDYVGLDGTVTYRLHAAGGATLPTTGVIWWSCFPADNDPPYPISYQTDQRGGNVFVCPVKSSEPWTAFWSREKGDRLWRAGYDPVGDRSRPTVSSVRVTAAPGSWLTTTMNGRISWAGRDRGSGLHHYAVQVQSERRSLEDGHVAVPARDGREQEADPRIDLSLPCAGEGSSRERRRVGVLGHRQADEVRRRDERRQMVDRVVACRPGRSGRRPRPDDRTRRHGPPHSRSPAVPSASSRHAARTSASPRSMSTAS